MAVSMAVRPPPMTTIGMRHLQVGERIELGGAGQLQGHEEIGRLAHAAHQAVLHRDDGGPARAGAERDVIEAQLEGAVDGEGAAEADAAVHAEFARAARAAGG